MLKYLLAAFLIISVYNAFAQTYVDVANQTITLNSTSNLTGNNRNYVRVDFPDKTAAYICRITISPKDRNQQINHLFELINKLAPAELAVSANLARYAVNTNDGSAVDTYVFSNTYDADSFVQKKDENLSACQQSNNVVNTCYASNQCLNPSLYFGFRNNNLVNGLDVHLEVVALVDSGKKGNSYTYSIANGAKQEVKCLVSADRQHWENVSLRQGYSITFTKELPVLYFRMFTSVLNFVNYDLRPDERYKIIWSSTNKWDLIRY
ncbi:hypothetical protein ABID99_003554 [Mucilaginibacter sp. OAE612]|uniref:hypothetical protein n=1 Tax=Mucilaginibacter sp. OAE612 TaxID=3156444 RepID=UPI00359D1969